MVEHPLQQPLVVVCGPTASGKTALAQAVAEYGNGCVLSADSMQIYRGMDIGTGKIPVSSRTVPYYGLDILNPGEPYSAALFQDYGRTCITDEDSRGVRTVVCGGTGLYIRALIDDFRFPKGEQVDNPVRTYYEQLQKERGNDAVWQMLNERDPRSAALIHPNNAKRVVRAFEMLEEHLSYADQAAGFSQSKPWFPVMMIGLSVTPDILRSRIDTRVDEMFDTGLVDEVKGLLNRGLRDAITANQAIGYKEVVAALDGSCSMEQARESIKIATHRYAKRQRTWFKRDKRITWLDVDSADTEMQLQQTIAILNNHDDSRL